VTPLRALGEELRRARERRGIALGAIAETTKISRGLLEGLERGDCSRWPGGLYSRSYVRDYAKAVGLPPGDVVRRFIACFADADQAVPATVEPSQAARDLPLRLTLGSDPAERRAMWVLRARLLALDAAIIFGSAVAVASATGLDFWIAAAAASLGCHASGVFRTGMSLAASIGTRAAAWWTQPEGQALSQVERLADVPRHGGP
jgi:transcriptional regulator with XRE-family HTH domain